MRRRKQPPLGRTVVFDRQGKRRVTRRKRFPPQVIELQKTHIPIRYEINTPYGNLTCSFSPAGVGPKGFIRAFERQFEEYLGLKVSVFYEIKLVDTEWVVCYRLKNEDQWVETTEILSGCTTEDDAFSSAWERMLKLTSVAERSGVMVHSNAAGSKFLSEINSALEQSLIDLFHYSCDYAKMAYAYTPMAKRLIGDEYELNKLSLGVRGGDDKSELKYPSVSSTNLRDAEVTRITERIFSKYAVDHGGPIRLKVTAGQKRLICESYLLCKRKWKDIETFLKKYPDTWRQKALDDYPETDNDLLDRLLGEIPHDVLVADSYAYSPKPDCTSLGHSGSLE